MAVNAWNLASANLLEDLAQREARQRQAQLDAQRAQELAADRAMRERQMQLSTKQVEASIANQEADNQRLSTQQILAQEEKSAAQRAAARREEELANLMNMYRTAQDPTGRQQVADNLALRGVRVADQAPKVPGSLAEALIAKGMDPDAAYREEMRLKTDEQIRQSRATRQSGEGGGGDTFMSLDAKTRQYLDTLPTKVDPATGQPYTMERALDEVRRQQGLTGLQGAIIPYLQRVFPQQNVPGTDPMTGLPSTTEARPGTAPVGAVPAADALTQAAIAKLREKGVDVNPQTIESAKALIAAGQ